MKNIVNSNELKTILKKFDFNITSAGIDVKNFIEVYHRNDWYCGYESDSVCVSKNGTIRNKHNGTRREFYTDLKIIFKFLIDYINFNNITYFIVAPLYNDWFSEKCSSITEDIYTEFYNFLKKYQTDSDPLFGLRLEIKENIHYIEMLLESSFRNVSNLNFLFPEHSVIIEISHHFNLVFLTNNFEKEKNKITDLLKNYPELCYHEDIYKSEEK